MILYSRVFLLVVYSPSYLTVHTKEDRCKLATERCGSPLFAFCKSLQWRFWLLRMISSLIHKTTQLPLYYSHKENKTTQPRRVGFQGRFLLKHRNQVSCGEKQSLQWNAWVWREDISKPQGHAGQQWDWDRREEDEEAKFQRYFTEHKLWLVKLWCRERPLPRMFTHTFLFACAHTGHSTQPQNKKHMHDSPHQILCALIPRHSLSSPACWSKIVYVCGVTLQVTSRTPTQHTLLYYISPIKAALAGFHSC